MFRLRKQRPATHHDELFSINLAGDRVDVETAEYNSFPCYFQMTVNVDPTERGRMLTSRSRRRSKAEHLADDESRSITK
jgi:hypothetical protein